MRNIRSTLLIFALSLTTTLAHAQSVDDSLHVVDETIVTGSRLAIPRANAIATKMPLPLRKTPLSVGIVPQALIETQDGATLSDALANVSGVGVHTNFGVHDLFYLRGFDSLANGLVLSDGAPEPEATFYQLYNVDRVEALKGPGAFLYGGNPLSGTINLVRKRPDPASDFARVNASLGSFSTYRATFDAGHALPDQNLALRLNALWQDAEGYRDDKNSSILAVNPTLRLNLGERSTLHLDFEYLTSEHKADAGLPLIAASQPFFNEGLLLLYGDALPNVPRTRSYQTPFDLSEQTILRFRADYEWHLSPNFTLRDKFYYTRLDWPSRGTLFGGTAPNASGSLDLIRLLNELDDEQAVVGNQLEALWALDTGGLKHQLLFGLEFSRHQDDFTLAVNFLPPINLFVPQEAATLAQLVPIPDQSLAGETSAQTLAPYFVDRITLSSRVEFFIGGRFDLVDYDKTSIVNQRDPSADSTYRPVPIDAQRDYRQLSPLLGVVFAPNDELSFYANAGGAFAPPSALAVGGLEPEKSRQGEVGAKAQLLDGKLDGRLALFHLQKDDIAIPDDNNLTRQLGDQRARGLELELWVRPASGWYAQASYAYLDAELTRFNELERKKLNLVSQAIVAEVVDRSGNAPAFAPEHLATLWAARDFGPHLTLAAGARYVGSQFAAEDNIYQIDGAMTFDLGLTYRQGPGLLRLNLKNLTNREYETRGFGAYSVIPAAPFSFKATLGYSL